MATFSPNVAAAPPAPQPSTPLRISSACDDGKKFAELFYDKVDKGRHAIGNLFHDKANLVWNGNHIQGKSNIVTFYETLPTSETTLQSIDAQPVLDLPELAGNQTITVICGGRQKFGSKMKFFTECFMLTAESGVWKIVTDTYRYFD